MDLSKLKSNSKQSKKERTMPDAVIKGSAKTKSKTTGRKVFESVLAEDFKTIKHHVIEDKIKPKFLELIFDAVTDGLELALFGMSGRKKRSSGSGYTSYGSYYKASGGSNGRPKSKPEPKKAVYDMDEIEFEFKEDAVNVLDRLCEDIQEYGNVSGEVLKHLLGEPANYTDRKYGWTDLSTATIDRIRGGSYILSLPRAEVIE